MLATAVPAFPRLLASFCNNSPFSLQSCSRLYVTSMICLSQTFARKAEHTIPEMMQMRLEAMMKECINACAVVVEIQPMNIEEVSLGTIWGSERGFTLATPWGVGEQWCGGQGRLQASGPMNRSLNLNPWHAPSVCQWHIARTRTLRGQGARPHSLVKLC